MARAVVFLLDIGTPETHLWCNVCMTSGGVRVRLLRLTEWGVSTFHIAEWCATCGDRGDLAR